MNDHREISGRCPCGSIAFETIGAPIFRAYCHCSICRRFNGTDYADMTVFRAADVRSVDEARIDFKAYKQPPLVQRGTCRECGRPAIEKARVPPMPRLVIVPSANLDDAVQLPAPVMHIFYDDRVTDVDDGITKHGGFVTSQLAFGAVLIKGLLARR